ncbi:hypothetical protein PSPO01_12477 [Paraphaeosphaeria sporulosa]
MYKRQKRTSQLNEYFDSLYDDKLAASSSPDLYKLLQDPHRWWTEAARPTKVWSGLLAARAADPADSMSQTSRVGRRHHPEAQNMEYCPVNVRLQELYFLPCHIVEALRLPIAFDLWSCSNQYPTPCLNCGLSDTHEKAGLTTTMTLARSWLMGALGERQRHDAVSELMATPGTHAYSVCSETRRKVRQEYVTQKDAKPNVQLADDDLSTSHLPN